MKIKIALCDDDLKALPIIAGAVESSFQARGVQTEISRFHSGDALLRALEESRFHLLLLDINMPGMDGIEVARKIREGNDNTKLAFVSDQESRVFECFQVQPLSFVRKSSFFTDLTAMVELYLKITAQEQERDDAYLDFTTRTGLLTLRSRQVLYIEGSRNYQLLSVEGHSEPMEVKMTMDKLEKMTGPCGFIRIHKGFLVNYRYIQHLSTTTVVLQNGAALPIGRSKSADVRQKYLALIGK